MSGEREPTRLTEQLDGATRGARAAYASQGPSSEQLARMGDRLMADIARGGVPRSERPAHGNTVWWLGSAGVLGVLLASLLALRPAVVETGRVQQPSATRPVAMESVQSAAPAQEVPTEPASPPESKRVARPARRAVPERVAPSAPADPQAELALLRPARQLLAVKPARSLELASEHEQRFPRGMFGEERAVIRIEALARLGQGAAAAQAARSFRKLHPTSTYLPRVNEIVAQP